jgi:hypothetical protein
LLGPKMNIRVGSPSFLKRPFSYLSHQYKYYTYTIQYYNSTITPILPIPILHISASHPIT